VTADVLVVGGGPAGRAVAAECGRRGLVTTLLDPAPDAPWCVTYGAWAAELPATLPGSTVAARARGRAIARTTHTLGRDYAVLDVAALRAHLDAELDAAGVVVRTGRAVTSSGTGGVEFADGTRVDAALVVDAGGHRQPLGGPGARGVAAGQTAYGVVVDESSATALVASGEALFMDWRADHGEPGWPTFLYGIPLGGGAMLLEETSLARRPGLPMPVLRRRLHARLHHHGIAVPPDAGTEKVHFRVDSPRHRASGVLGFGAAAPLVHPASGFSLAAALTLAPAVAGAIAARWPSGPAAALAAAQAVVWSPQALAVHRLRRIGLEALLRMPPPEVVDFFEVFFALPDRHQWAYLGDRDDLAGTAATMAALFTRSDWRLRYRLVGPALRRPAPPVDREAAPIG